MFNIGIVFYLKKELIELQYKRCDLILTVLMLKCEERIPSWCIFNAIVSIFKFKLSSGAIFNLKLSLCIQFNLLSVSSVFVRVKNDKNLNNISM